MRSYLSRIEEVITASSGNGGLYCNCRKSNASRPIISIPFLLILVRKPGSGFAVGMACKMGGDSTNWIFNLVEFPIL